MMANKRNRSKFLKFPMLSGILVTLFFTDFAFANVAILDENTVAVGEISESPEAEAINTRGTRDKGQRYTTVNGQNVIISCTTARNLDGECRPFGECYPIFKLREQRLNDRQLKNRGNSLVYSEAENKVNDELQSIYKSVSGDCSDFVLESIAKALGHPVARQNYVCCPIEQNYTRVNRPSRPAANSPTYQNQQCGKYVGRAENETFNDDLQVTARIVNGRPAGRGEFPWTVALMQNGRQFCGGSLIDANHVLTAAHCVYFMNGGDVRRLRIQIGDHNIYSTNDGPHENRGASNVYYHRAFSMRTLTDDVALIRLSNRVSFNRYIQPICLSSNTWAWESQSATVSGWGQVSERGSQSAILRTVNVNIWKQSDCIRKYRGRAPAGITNGMVCAGGRGSDSCKGDSGGPLNVWRNKRAEQLGIVSWGIGCGTFPGVYTRVDMYLNWINKNRR